MVTRVRIDAEGRTRDEVEAHLNAAFQLLYQNSATMQFTFAGPGFTSQPFGPTAVVPRESEFVEEVYESDITTYGPIHWKGRRTMKFIPTRAELGLLEIEEAIAPVILAPAPVPAVDHGPADDPSGPQSTSQPT